LREPSRQRTRERLKEANRVAPTPDFFIIPAAEYVFDSIEFNKPMFLTMYANALFSLYLLGFVFSADWRSELHRSYRMCFAHTPSAHSCEPQEYDGYESDQDEADEGRPLIPHGKRRPKAIPMAMSGGGGTGHRATPASKIRVGGMIDEMDPISENKSFHASLQPAAAPAMIEARERIVAGGSMRSVASVIQEEEDSKSTVLAPHQVHKNLPLSLFAPPLPPPLPLPPLLTLSLNLPPSPIA
jgi:hypothetical protein